MIDVSLSYHCRWLQLTDNGQGGSGFSHQGINYVKWFNYRNICTKFHPFLLILRLQIGKNISHLNTHISYLKNETLRAHWLSAFTFFFKKIFYRKI